MKRSPAKLAQVTFFDIHIGLAVASSLTPVKLPTKAIPCGVHEESCLEQINFSLHLESQELKKSASILSFSTILWQAER